jgi:preprotein translocase subunit Sec63
MKRWSYDIFGSIRQQVKKLSLDVDKEKVNSLVSLSSPDVTEIEKQLHDAYEREELMYKHRSHQDWLKYGDRNNK